MHIVAQKEFKYFQHIQMHFLNKFLYIHSKDSPGIIEFLLMCHRNNFI